MKNSCFRGVANRPCCDLYFTEEADGNRLHPARPFIPRAGLPFSRKEFVVKVFITGITGFVGSYLAEHLIQQGDTVLGADLDPWSPALASTPVAKVEVVPWDIAGNITETICDRVADFEPDAIVHLAAISIPADCGVEEPTPEALATNVDGTRAVMHLAASLPSPPRVLFVSSMHVYANVKPLASVVDEHSPVNPISPYGLTKLRGENIIHEAANEDGIEAVIVRAFQHSGPRQGPRLMLADWVKQVIHHKSNLLKLRRREVRTDITDVRDIVRAYRLLLEKGTPGATYNVGSGVLQRGEDILDLLFEVRPPRLPVEELSPGEQWRPVADITKIMKETGWSPRIPLRNTLTDMIEWESRK